MTEQGVQVIGAILILIGFVRSQLRVLAQESARRRGRPALTARPTRA